jgi:hypothetical protein
MLSWFECVSLMYRASMLVIEGGKVAPVDAQQEALQELGCALLI